MSRARRPLFLARAPYRRRRLRDAARLLPFLGLFLLLLPLLWAPEARTSLRAADVVYFFALWLVLIALAAAFAPGLRGGDGADGHSAGGHSAGGPSADGYSADGQGDGDDD